MPRAVATTGALVLLPLLTLVAASAGAATSVYSSESQFLASLLVHLTDDYQNLEYQYPDAAKGTFSDARMSEIVALVAYQATGFPSRNVVERQGGQAVYCAGCNGSFALHFTGSPLGNDNGVHAVGLRIVSNQPDYPYVAFVTYGDHSTENFELPTRKAQTVARSPVYWAISTQKRIRSIHFGGANGATMKYGAFAIDDLTVGALLLPDTDGDGIPDPEDNCIAAPNGPLQPDEGGWIQRDTDDDGYGNMCDADLDNSGLVTVLDVNLFRGCLNEAASTSALCAAADINGSGLVTSVDFNLMRGRLNQAPGPSGLH